MRVLVVPVFNEERTILSILEGARGRVDRIVVLDDGSSDGSAALIASWMRGISIPIDLVHHTHNRGLSHALLTMFAHIFLLARSGHLAPDDQVVIIDADGQHDPADIPRLAERLARELDVVVGARDLRVYPRYKRVGNALLSVWASLLSGRRHPDAECGFRAFRVAVTGDLLGYCTGFRYSIAQEMSIVLPRLRYRVQTDVPVSVLYYRQGARFRDGAANATMGLWAAVRVLLRLRHDPLHRAVALLSGVRIESNGIGASEAAVAWQPSL